MDVIKHAMHGNISLEGKNTKHQVYGYLFHTCMNSFIQYVPVRFLFIYTQNIWYVHIGFLSMYISRIFITYQLDQVCTDSFISYTLIRFFQQVYTQNIQDVKHYIFLYIYTKNIQYVSIRFLFMYIPQSTQYIFLVCAYSSYLHTLTLNL